MNNIIRKNYDPFLDLLFEAPFYKENSHGELMKTDIEELNDSFRLTIEVPSVKKEDIRISFNEGYLDVEVEKKNMEVEKDNKGKILHKERFFGTLKRSYYLGDEIDENEICAKLENGELVVVVKKLLEKEEKKIKYINIQ